jgi:SNF2 family DNA or RNA helicase
LREAIAAIGDCEVLHKTEPRRHQLEGLAFALWAERSLLFYDMRTGKTLIALDWISYLIYSGLLTKKALVIAHAPIGADVWEQQIAEHSHLDVAIIRSGGDAQDRLLRALLDKRYHAVVVSWSTLQQAFGVQRTVARGSKTGRQKIYADLPALREAARSIDAVAIDEIHMAGHHETLRFRIASELVAHSRWRLGLTGTPFGRNPLLLWGQAYLMDGGATLGRSFYFFRECFCNAKWNPFSRSFSDFTFDDNKLPLLRDKMRAMSLHCALSEVQDVNVLKGVVRLTMSDEQAQAYDEAVNKLVQLRIGNTVEIDSVFVRLRQIASGFLPFDNEAGERRVIDFPDAAKFVWLGDLLDDPDTIGDMQIAIMHEFIHTGERICKLLDERRLSYDWLHGSTKDRPQLLERFKSGQTQILVANTATGGMSIDLSTADYLLFFESTASVIVRRQAEARPLARGSRPLVMDDLVCAPIEQKLLNFLDQGEGLREALLRHPQDMAEQLRR